MCHPNEEEECQLSLKQKQAVKEVSTDKLTREQPNTTSYLLPRTWKAVGNQNSPPLIHISIWAPPP